MTNNSTRGLKIFSGAGFVKSQHQTGIIIAASSRKKAVQALRAHGILETESHMASHWMVIAHPDEAADREHYALAVASPETPFAESSYRARDYSPVRRTNN